jgi:CDP-glucose 4,6-dehydratase
MEKRFAITGATGLLGSNLINRLSSLDENISVLIKDENSKSILAENVTKIYGDISDRNDIDYFIQRTNPTHFIHLAAQTQAYESLKYPYATFYNNVLGTLNILESLRDFNNCRVIMVASSDKAYGSLIGDKYTESHPLNGIYPYDASKSATDIISNSYRQTYNLPIVTTRACNIYGYGDYNQQRIIPGIIYSYLKNREFIIRNGGNDFREYIYVEDLVDAYLNIIEYVESENLIPSFNITSRDGLTTLELFHLIQEIVGKPIQHSIVNNPSLEIAKQVMDDSLIRAKTNWSPRHKLRDTLQDVVEWYLAKA